VCISVWMASGSWTYKGKLNCCSDSRRQKCDISQCSRWTGQWYIWGCCTQIKYLYK